MKKALKNKFLAYFLVLILLLFFGVVICFGVLYFFPGTTILGYEFVVADKTYKEEIEYTNLVNQNITSLKIQANYGNVVLRPNSQSNNLVVNYDCNYSGIVKEVNSGDSFDIKYEEINFDSTGEQKTLVIYIEEPSGSLFNSSSVVEVSLPYSFMFNHISSSCENGQITFEGNLEVEGVNYGINTVNVHFDCGNNGKITLKNLKSTEDNYTIDNYYISTESGSVGIDNVSSFYAESFSFESKRGILNFTNSNKSSIFSLKNALTIKSNDGIGPTINIDNLYADLDVEANKGTFNFNQIGKENEEKNIKLELKDSKVNIDTCYGIISVNGNGDSLVNKVSINSLVNNSGDKNNFRIGAGSLSIGSLVGSSNVSSTSGKISINNVDFNSSISAVSTTGSISIKYVYSQNQIASTQVKIITEKGNITLENISGKLKLDVLEDSKNSSLNVMFSAITNDLMDNDYINARDRNINLSINGVSDDLRFRVVSKSPINFSVGVSEQVENIDSDYILNDSRFADYDYEYRVRYYKEDGILSTYYGNRILIVNTTGQTIFNSILTPQN